MKKVLVWLSEKWFEMLGLVITVFSVFLAIYFYSQTLQERTPVFTDESYRVLIAMPTEVSKPLFKIIRNNGQEIKGNIFATTLYFFNAGALPIKPENILSPLKIVLEDKKSEILDLRVAKYSRDIVCPTVSRDIASPKNTFDINFKILEKEDGISFYVVYAGGSSVKFKLNGVVEGTKGEISTQNIESKYFWKYIFSDRFFMLQYFLIIFMGGYMIYMLSGLKVRRSWAYYVIIIAIIFSLVTPIVIRCWGALGHHKQGLKAYIAENVPSSIL